MLLDIAINLLCILAIKTNKVFYKLLLYDNKYYIAKFRIKLYTYNNIWLDHSTHTNNFHKPNKIL